MMQKFALAALCAAAVTAHYSDQYSARSYKGDAYQGIGGFDQVIGKEDCYDDCGIGSGDWYGCGTGQCKGKSRHGYTDTYSYGIDSYDGFDNFDYNYRDPYDDWGTNSWIDVLQSAKNFEIKDIGSRRGTWDGTYDNNYYDDWSTGFNPGFGSGGFVTGRNSGYGVRY